MYHICISFHTKRAVLMVVRGNLTYDFTNERMAMDEYILDSNFWTTHVKIIVDYKSGKVFDIILIYV